MIRKKYYCEYCFKNTHLKENCPIIFDWSRQRILWIGYLKNDSSCILSKLPKEIFLEIISFCKVYLFQDAIDILKKYEKPKASNEWYERPYCWLSTSNYISPKNLDKYFGKLKCFVGSHVSLTFFLNVNKLPDEEMEIIKLYGFRRETIFY